MKQSKYQTRGSIYITVLSVSVLATIIGISSILASRIQNRENKMITQGTKAKINAESGIAYALNYINKTADWRTKFKEAAGTLGPFTLPSGQGSFQMTAIDTADADLTNNQTDPVTLYVTGQDGHGAYHMAVNLKSQINGVAALNGNAYAGLNIQIANGKFSADKKIYIKNTLSSSIFPLQANADIGLFHIITSQIGIRGKLNPNFASHALPVMDNLITTYQGLGQNINSHKISKIANVYYITNKTIGPTSPPYNASPSANGIYHLNCHNKTVMIINCTIRGTLVLSNAAHVYIQGNTTWEPAKPNYPALIVQGSGILVINNSSGNMNLQGIIYTQHTVHLKGTKISITGTLMTSTSIFSNDNTDIVMTYQPQPYDTPPPGFAGTARMVIIPKSYRQVDFVPGKTVVPVVATAGQ